MVNGKLIINQSYQSALSHCLQLSIVSLIDKERKRVGKKGEDTVQPIMCENFYFFLWTLIQKLLAGLKNKNLAHAQNLAQLFD